MAQVERETVYDIGGLFRVDHQPVSGRPKPYEFVRRIGAVTTLPIICDEAAAPQALVIQNEKYHYGTSVDLPAGNADGGFDTPEHPAATAVRELQEETGYGYESGVTPELSLFRLRNISNTIDYPRFFVVMHGVVRVGGEQPTDHERITHQPIPIADYVEPLFGLQRGETYPEVNAAFAKAGNEVGRAAVMNWLIDPQPAVAEQIAQSFQPWLLSEPSRPWA